MVSFWDKLQFYFYKYILTGFFVTTLPYIVFLGYRDLTTSVSSIFTTVSIVWLIITGYLVNLSYGLSLEEFLE